MAPFMPAGFHEDPHRQPVQLLQYRTPDGTFVWMANLAVLSQQRAKSDIIKVRKTPRRRASHGG